MANKTRRFEIRFTEKQFARIKERADSAGMTVTHFIRTRALKNSEASVMNGVEFLKAYKEHNRELNAIGNNINQLARYANFMEQNGQIQETVIHELNKMLSEYVRCQNSVVDVGRKLLKA